MNQSIAFPESVKSDLLKLANSAGYVLAREILARGKPDELLLASVDEAQVVVDVARVEMMKTMLQSPFWDEDDPRHDAAQGAVPRYHERPFREDRFLHRTGVRGRHEDLTKTIPGGTPLTSAHLVSWHQLTAPQQAQVRRLQIDRDQTAYAGTIERALDTLAADARDQLGVAVLSPDAVVGFLLLKRGSRAPAWAGDGTTVISGMRVDRRHQAKGYGSAALSALPRWLRQHWPEATRLALSVDEENVHGIAAYARAGFLDSGRREPGRIGWVRYMFRPALGTSGERASPRQA